MAHPLIALLTMLLCAVVSPVFAEAPTLNSTVSSLPSSLQTYSLVQQGKILYDTGQFAEAVKILQQAVQIYQSQGYRLKQATVLSNLSLAYQQLGLWSEATKAITDSLSLLHSQPNLGNSKDHLQVLAQILNTQGRLQLALGQPEQALTTWQQAQATYTQAGDRAGIALSLINQAQALQALGLELRACQTLQQALGYQAQTCEISPQVNQAFQKQPDSLLKAVALRNLGDTLRLIGDLKQSQEVLNQSLEIAKRWQSSQEIGAVLLSLGNLARLKQDTPAALVFYQQAATASPSLTTKLQAQLNQLNLLLETQQWSEGEALWPQLLSQITNLPPSHQGIYARIDFAQSLIKLLVASRQSSVISSSGQQTTGIAQLLATAVQQSRSIGDQRAEAYALGSLGGLYEHNQQWSIAQDLTQQALLKAQFINAPDIAYRWQWQLGRLFKVQADIPKAITVYTEAVSTLQSLRSDLVTINPDIQFSFREEVEPVYRQLVDLLLQPSQAPPSQGEKVPSQAHLKLARQIIESLQLAELDNYFRSACLQAKVDIDKLVDQENSKAAVIYPIFLEQRLEAIIKLPGQKKLRHYTTTIAQDKVERTLARLRSYLQDVTQTHLVNEQSQQVYDWLIRPVEAELANSNIKTLVFVLDGALRNIPMAILYDKQQNKYLVEKYAIALTPGLQLINPKPLQPRQLNALIAGVDEKRQVQGREFPALENVARELREIQSEVLKSRELLNQQFTTINLQNQLQSSPFSVVHLATHGEFSSNPEETFILTWDKLLNVKDFDQLLRLSDQSGSSTIELLVLSACKTAQGDKRAALGLAGVALRAGARSTLATLWSVDDKSTSELMSQFYRELKTGVSKAEALQQAQLAILKSEKRPYFWAPYVLVGNWL